VGEEAGAGDVIGIKELARAADGVVLAIDEVLVVGGGEEGGLVVIEPPGDVGRGGVFEVDDGVFVARELALVKQRPGAMDEAVVLVAGVPGDALAVEAREEGG